MALFDIQRIATSARITLHVVLVFVVLNFGLWMITTLMPNVIRVPKQFMGVDFVEQNLRKAHAVMLHYRGAGSGEDEELTVIFGLSSASEGISVQQFQATLDEGQRVMSLSGAGRNFREIALYANPIVEADFRPRRVILAINPFHLVDPPESNRTVRELVSQLSWKQLAFGWCTAKREDLRCLIEMKMLALRLEVLSWFGQTEPKAHSPWADSTLMGIPPTTTESAWQSRLDEYGQRGYYDLANYENSKRQLDEFAHLIEHFESTGSDVIVVLMPEHSRLFSRIPGNAFNLLLDAMEARISRAFPPTIDCRRVMPDTEFNDISHLNASGRLLFTRLLIERLEQAGDGRNRL